MALPIPKTFGQHVAEMRRARGLTQKDVAALAGISPQYLCDVEHDRRLPDKTGTLTVLANALAVDRELLMLLAGRLPPGPAMTVRQSSPALVQLALDAFRAKLRSPPTGDA